jgi:tetratricopeptide (TPR) repeat protein
MGYPLKALDAYREAEKIPIQDKEDAEVAAGILSNIANVLIDLNRPQEAHGFINQAEEVHRESIHRDWLGEIIECRARAFYLEGRFDEATEAAERATEILRHCDGQRALNEARRTLAACWAAKREAA